MTKLLIDASSILGAFMHLNDEEFGVDVVFEGEKFHIPSLETCIERAESSFQRTITHLGISPTDMIMVRDQEGTGAARKLIYPEYKGKRDKRPRQFYTVFNALVEHICNLVMGSGGIVATPRVVPAVEGDDLINELAIRLPKTIIWTRDKDLLSCPATHHYIEGEIDPLKFPVPQRLIRLYRAIVTGDTSDNIPSCKGFGDKTWEKLQDLIGWEGMDQLDLMVQQKRLHELASEVKDFKALQLLVDQAETVYLAYELISFMPVPARKIKWEARIESDVTKTLVTADNFEICKSQVMASCKTAESVVIDYETDIPDEAREWLAGTFDPETGKQAVMVDVIGSEICGMGLKIGLSCWYFSVDHADTANITLAQLAEIIELIREMRVYAHNSTGFENIVTYNSFGLFMEDILDTRIMANYIDEAAPSGLKPSSKRWLQYEQETYAETLQKAQDARPDVEVLGMRQVTGEEVLSYGIDDVVVCDGLQNLWTTVLQYEKSYGVFLEVEQKSALMTSLAFIKGVPFNREAHARLKAENDVRTAEFAEKVEAQLLKFGWGDSEFRPFPLLNSTAVKGLYKYVMGAEIKSQARSVKGLLAAVVEEGVDGPRQQILDAVGAGLDVVNALAKSYWRPSAKINTRSPKQVAELLYDRLGCVKRIVNPATDAMRAKGVYEGNAATNDAAFRNAIAWKDTTPEGIQLLNDITEWKKCLTRESLFLRKYPPLVHWKTGRLHCNMMQSATTTRRFTHSSPQFGQLPKKRGREVRDLLIAPEGWSFVSLDFSSQELRLAAWDSQCEKFLACYIGTPEERQDVHSSAGWEISLKSEVSIAESKEAFLKKISEGDTEAKNMRAKGKTVVFATQYLCQAKKLSQELCCSEAEAMKYMTAKSAAFPGLDPHVEKYIETCRARGYSLTFLGGRRHLAKEFAMKSAGEQASAGRLAWSFRIQGSAAEQTKLAMGSCWNSGLLLDSLCFPATIVHDEAVLLIRDDVLESKVRLAHACVTQYYGGMKLKPESTPEVGKTFGQLKEMKLDLNN